MAVFYDDTPRDPPTAKKADPDEFYDDARWLTSHLSRFGGALASGVRSIAEKSIPEDDSEPSIARGVSKIAKGLSSKADAAATKLEAGMSTRNRRAADAEFFPEEGGASVWEDPLRSLYLKLVASTPEMAATAAAGRAAGPPGMILTGMASASSQIADEVYKRIDEASESDLVKLPEYARARKDGMSIEKARRHVARVALDGSHAGPTSLMYGLLNTLGLEAAFAGTGFSKAVGKKMLGRAAATGVEEGVQEFGQTAGGDISSQASEIATGERDTYNPMQTLDRSTEAALQGAALGGAIGGALGTPKSVSDRKRPEVKADVPPDIAIAVKSSQPETAIITPAPVVDTIVETVTQQAQAAADQARAANPAPVVDAPQPAVPQAAGPVDTGNTGALQEPPAAQQQDIDDFEDNADLILDDEEDVPEAAPAALPQEVTPNEVLPAGPVRADGAADAPVLRTEPQPDDGRDFLPVEDVLTDLKPAEEVVKRPPRILPDIPKVKELAEARRQKEAKAKADAAKKGPQGQLDKGGERTAQLRRFQRKMEAGTTADKTGNRPKIVAEILANREKATTVGEKIKANNALLKLMDQEIAEQAAADKVLAKEIASENAEPIEVTVSNLAKKFSASPAEVRTGRRGMTAFYKRLRGLNKALDTAAVSDSAHPFVAAARGLRQRIAKDGYKATVADINQLAKLQDKAEGLTSTKPESVVKPLDADKTDDDLVAAEEEAPERHQNDETEARVVHSRRGPVKLNENVLDDKTTEVRQKPASGDKLTDEARARVTNKEFEKLPKDEQDKLVAAERKKVVAERAAALGPRRESRGSKSDEEVILKRFKPSNRVFKDHSYKYGIRYEAKLGDALNDLDAGRIAVSHLKGKTSKGAAYASTKFMQETSKRLGRWLKDVDVYIVEDLGDDTAGQYFPFSHTVLINHDVLTNGEYDETVLHEAVHAAFYSYIESNPQAKVDLGILFQYVKGRIAKTDKTEYSTKNLHEMLAEAFANPDVQIELAKIDIPVFIQRQLGIPETKSKSAWQALVDLIARALGFDNKNALSTIMAVVDNIEAGYYEMGTSSEAEATEEAPKRLMRAAKSPDAPKNLDFSGKLWNALRKTLSFDQLGITSEKYLGKVVKKIADMVEQRRITMDKYIEAGNDLIRRMVEAERVYAKDWEEFTSLIHDLTIANVYAHVGLDHELNRHLGKNSTRGVQGKARHAELQRRWFALPQELQKLALRNDHYYRQRQNAMSLNLIENAIEAAIKRSDKALAKRIHEGTADDADWQFLNANKVVKTIANAQALKKLEGFYAPLTREGKKVVTARYELTKDNLHGGTVIGKDVVQFTNPTPGKRGGKAAAKRNLHEYLKGTDLRHLGTQIVHVDPANHNKIVPAEDPNGVYAIRVKMQTKHVSFHDEASAAEEERQALEKEPGVTDVSGVQEARNADGTPGADILSSDFRMMARNAADGNKKVEEALNQMAILVLGGTRVQSRRLPRRFVQGASKDFTRTLSTYNVSTAGYLAKTETQPKLDTLVEEMDKYVEDHKTESSDKTQSRTQIRNEVKLRLKNLDEFMSSQSSMNKYVDTFLNLSQLDKLASPSYHMINAIQTAMVTNPVLAGRHGWGKTLRAVSEAYKIIGALDVIGSGFKDFARAGKAEGANFARYLSRGQPADAPVEVTKQLENLYNRVGRAPNGTHLKKLLDEMQTLMNADASFEVGLLVANRNVEGGRASKALSGLGTTLQRANFISRQIGQAVETMNRAASAVAAFNLEFARNGGDADAAIEYAKQIVSTTHFNYSQTNAPPIMSDRHPVARIALQFKKYSQNMTFLLVRSGYLALKGETPAVRKEAAKQLAFLMASTGTMAGALGLPGLEVFKLGVMALSALGLIDDDWEDVERAVEDQLGTVLSHGLPNVVGVDLSTRLGLNNMWVYGEPTGGERKDTEAYLWSLVGGAPGSYAVDVVTNMDLLPRAAMSYLSGNPEEGTKQAAEFFEKTIPLKILTDSIAAYKLATEGKTNKKGEQVTPPSLPRAALKVLGFTATEDAEARRSVRNMYSDLEERKAARQGLFDKWKDAKSSERLKIWKEIQTFNKNVPEKARISRSALDAAVKRAATVEKEKGVYLGRDVDLAQ
jgi:hypothetical protein